MCGWAERNLECSDAFAGDALLMTSVSASRSAVAACCEYPGSALCARKGKAMVSAIETTSRLIIREEFLNG